MSAARCSTISARVLFNSHYLLSNASTARSPNFFKCARTFSISNKTMKYIQFSHKNSDEIRVGYIDGENVVDINKADSSLPSTMLGILRNDVADKVSKLKNSKPESVPLSSVTLAAPIYGVDKVLCVALNYADHCKEQNIAQPAIPIFFSKFSSTIIGPNECLRLRTDICKRVPHLILNKSQNIVLRIRPAPPVENEYLVQSGLTRSLYHHVWK